MRSPPHSSGMFLSSPILDIGLGPTDEVETLLISARLVDTLPDTLAQTIAANKAVFLDVFGRQIQLLKSRSQAFEDGHITVYDKVLLQLTDNGNNLESPAAIAWYCAEFLGVSPEIESFHNAQLIEQAFIMPANIFQGSQQAHLVNPRNAKYPQALTPSSSRKNSADASCLAITTSIDKFPKLSDGSSDPNFTHLWSVYSKAYNDYYNLADKRGNHALEAAKFLRDTAENGIHFLRNKYPGNPMSAELKNTYQMAKSVVLNLNGGRKRKFDYAVESNRKPQELIPHTASHDRIYAETRRQRKSNRGKPKPRGRGPSGIPYGYTRPVDSYYPV